MPITSVSPKVNTVGTILFVMMFVLSGFDKLRNTTKVATGLQNRLLKIPELSNIRKGLTIENCSYMIIVAAILQLLSSYYLVNASVNYKSLKARKCAKHSALAIMLFTIAATYVYHWYPRGGSYYGFISNISTIGASIIIYYHYSNM